MLTLFADETENGKLYINYPMIESIRYTKELPDTDYANYIVSREECKDFKRLARDFRHTTISTTYCSRMAKRRPKKIYEGERQLAIS